MTQQQELFCEQPRCPGCGSNNVATENATAGKCQRCGWRCRIAPDGTTTDWLKITQPAHSRRGTRAARRRC